MTIVSDHHGPGRGVPAVLGAVPGAAGGQRCGRLVSELLAELPSDAPFSARAFLAQHPELTSVRSAVLDVAYEDYCRRLEAGETVNRHEFAAEFPHYRTSLLRLLKDHDELDAQFNLLQRPLQWPAAGDEFLGFQLVSPLGRGAFSRVFLARESQVGDREVAVKITRHSGVEQHALGKLRHPHIVQVYTVKRDPLTGLTAICMPYLGRLTLHDLYDTVFGDGLPESGALESAAARGQAGDENIPSATTEGDDSASRSPPTTKRRTAPRDARLLLSLFEAEVAADAEAKSLSAIPGLETLSYVDAVLHLGWQLALALEHAHRRRIYHCDIKPSNVLLTREGGAMLLDFNLAVIGDREAGLGGTLPYMAPEQLCLIMQLRGDPHAAKTHSLDGKNDIFSLGVVLYELLCGALPWGPLAGDVPRDRLAEEQRKLLHHRPTSLRSKNPEVDAGTTRLVEACLSADPTRRPSAAEFARALRWHLSTLGRLGRAVRSRRKALLAAAGVLMGGSSLVGYAFAVVEPAPVRSMRLAKAAYEQRDYPTAMLHLDAVLQREPQHAEAQFLLGRCWMLTGERLRAQNTFSHLIARFPRNPYVAACLGWCLASNPDAMLSDFEMAEANFKVAQSSLPSNSALCNNLGYCLSRRQQFPFDQQWLKRAIALDPNSATAHYNLAIASSDMAFQPSQVQRRRCLLDAAKFAEKAAALAPRSGGIHLEAIQIHAILLRQQNLLSPEERAACVEKAMWHCNQAWRFGCSYPSIVKVTERSELSDALKMANLTAQSRELTSAASLSRLLDPLEKTSPFELASLR